MTIKQRSGSLALFPPAVNHSMVSIAHLTDPHLPLAAATGRELMSKRMLGWLSWRLRRWRNHRLECLDAVTSSIRAASPDAIAITGDLVNISTRAEFTAARRWLQSLGSPREVMLVPGNHDHYTADATSAGLPGLAPWMSASGNGGDVDFPSVRYLGNVALIGLDSTYPAPWTEASGLLGEEQLSRLAAMLDDCAAKGLCRVILIHHPPLAELATSPRKALKDAEALRQVVERHGAEVVLFGHNHLWMHEQLPTRTGIAHLLAAPSASMANGRSKPAAGWQLLSISRKPGQWHISVARHSIEKGISGTTIIERLELSNVP